MLQGASFDPIKDLSIKATDVDGKDITNKVLIENDVNTDLEGSYNVLASVINQNGRKIEKKFDVVVNPAENLDLDNNTNSNIMSRIFGGSYNVLASVINQNGRKIEKKFDVVVNPAENLDLDNNTNSNIMSRIFGLNSNNYEKNNTKSRSLQTKSTLNGSDTKSLTQSVKVTGTVTKKDGSAPDGKIEVELPTTMSFSVDQKGNFSAGDFKVTNHSSTDIQVSILGRSKRKLLCRRL